METTGRSGLGLGRDLWFVKVLALLCGLLNSRVLARPGDLAYE